MAALTIDRSPQVLGQLKPDPSACALPGGAWHIAAQAGDGLSFDLPAGLGGMNWVWMDLLLDGDCIAVFSLALHEPGDKDHPARVFRFSFSLLPQCSARLRLPLTALNQNQWSFQREGACLKRMAGGDRVDPAKVVRATLTVSRKSERPVRFAATALGAQADAPPALTKPLLPKGKLLDEMGQSLIRTWPARTRSVADCTARLRQQLADAPRQKWPDGFTKWGGSAGMKLGGASGRSGFFRTHFDGRRWWLVDPDGCAFWSAGMDCVRSNIDSAFGGLETGLSFLPDAGGEFKDAYMGRRGGAFNYLGANFIRAFGGTWRQAWGTISLSHLRAWGFNTVANWSEWNVARAAAFPYVRDLSFHPRNTPLVYRDFPDVFAPTMAGDALAYAEQLKDTKDDPALIGYFLMNEPTWGFSSESPALGMLYTHATSHARDRFAGWLKEKYVADGALAQAWQIDGLTFSSIASGRWETSRRFGPKSRAKEDCAAFSTVMADRLFRALAEACRKIDPNHLNLGARYQSVPPAWALAGMKCFDVFSFNCYRDRVPPGELKHITDALGCPVMIGEYHFGALDAGLPGSGIGRVATQADRGMAFRVYTETAAALPQCVGVHYFTFYDQSPIGRFDGEAYQIGFLDVCNRPYAQLCDAARLSHARLYEVAVGNTPAYTDAPKYLPKLF